VPDLPEWMQEIILHCLEVEAEKRYATAAQLAFDLTHPDHVPLTERATRLKRAGLPTIVRRWWRSSWQSEHGARAVPTSHLAQAPQILVALAPGIGREALLQAILAAVRRAAAADANCRIMCVTVLEPDVSTEQEAGHELVDSLYTRRLVELHHWLPNYSSRLIVCASMCWTGRTPLPCWWNMLARIMWIRSLWVHAAVQPCAGCWAAFRAGGCRGSLHGNRGACAARPELKLYTCNNGENFHDRHIRTIFGI